MSPVNKVSHYFSLMEYVLLSVLLQDILRAVKIVNAMRHAHSSQLGAVGLDVGDGITEMIDAPMLKQVSMVANTIYRPYVNSF
jgi:hypothetical protein